MTDPTKNPCKLELSDLVEEFKKAEAKTETNKTEYDTAFKMMEDARNQFSYSHKYEKLVLSFTKDLLSASTAEKEASVREKYGVKFGKLQAKMLPKAAPATAPKQETVIQQPAVKVETVTPEAVQALTKEESRNTVMSQYAEAKNLLSSIQDTVKSVTDLNAPKLVTE